MIIGRSLTPLDSLGTTQGVRWRDHKSRGEVQNVRTNSSVPNDTCYGRPAPLSGAPAPAQRPVDTRMDPPYCFPPRTYGGRPA
jgi:hypothetical protein